MNKIYYQCVFSQLSPLRIGSGGGDESDADVIKDRRGRPFIPGTSIAGVLRSCFLEEEAKHLFGFVKIAGKDYNEKAYRVEDPMEESRILVSDAVLAPGKEVDAAYEITLRDGVGLNDAGTAVTGAKFDYEVVDCSEPYTAVLELSHEIEQAQVDTLESILRRIVNEGISFGARTTRGYGRMNAKVYKREFHFPVQLDDWLTFDAFDQERFGGDPLAGDIAEDAGQILIDIEITMTGGFSVRQPTTRLPDEQRGEKTAPDSSPLSNRGGFPVIPGTSWGGSFRHHMRDLIRDGMPEDQKERMLSSLDCLFGMPMSEGKSKGKKHKSEIKLSETSVEESARYNVTRTAIDRFTNAPSSQALFTSEIAQGGKGSLQIRLPVRINQVSWPELAKDYPVLLKLLAAALFDLDCGLMTVGGEGSVGRGICKITALKVNGEDKLATLREEKNTGFILDKWDALRPGDARYIKGGE